MAVSNLLMRPFDLTKSILSDKIEKTPTLSKFLGETPCGSVLGVVVYDLPGRDCAAKASNGELKVGEINRYKTEYIDCESFHSQLFYNS